MICVLFCFYFFLDEEGVDDGAPVTAADQNFFCLRNLEIHSLFLLIPADL